MFEIEAKKSLGQNFLKNTTTIERIVEAGDIQPGDFILEIGPGTGAMTGIILEKVKKAGQGAKLLVIEKDARAIPILEAKFKAEIDANKLIVLEGDFLEMEISDIISPYFNNTGQKSQEMTYTIIANIPYYITGAIIRKALEDTLKPKRAIFLVQKEVAERITRREGGGKNKGKSNILAESVAAYGTAEYLFTVVRGNFTPMPKVDSAAICISDISNKRFEQSGVSEKAFFEVMKAGFAHKRKKASSNLKEFMLKKGLDSETAARKLAEIFSQEKNPSKETGAKEPGDEGAGRNAQLRINQDARAEEINTELWFEIAKKIQSVL